MNKRKSQEWFLTRGLYLPKVETAIPSRKRKILFDYDLVKRQYRTENKKESSRVLVTLNFGREK